MEKENVKPLTPKDSGLAYSFMIILLLLATITVGSILSAVLDAKGTAYKCLSALIAPLSLTIIVIIFSIKSKTNILQISNVKKCNPLYFIVALCIAGGMFLGLGFVNGSIVSFLKSLGLKIPDSSISSVDSVLEYVLFSFFICVLPAITEEAFFRGLIFNGLKGLKTGLIIVYSSLLFALYHLSVAQLVYQFIYGCLLAFLTYKAKSSLPSMLAHFINNFVIVNILFFNISEEILNSVFIILIGVALLIVAVLFLFFYKRQRDGGAVYEKQSSFFMPFGIIGISMTALIIILGAVI